MWSHLRVQTPQHPPNTFTFKSNITNMRLLTLTAALAATALATPALVDRQNTCFDPTRVVCLTCGVCNISPSLALQAVTKACQQIPTCVPGGAAQGPVTGKVPSYTATLTVGSQCAGVTNWSLDACIALFDDQINTVCQARLGTISNYRCEFYDFRGFE
jgi:hypothetical protein